MERYCQECGAKLTENQAFCPECGTPLQKPDIEENKESLVLHTTAPVTKAREKRPMSLKKKISVTLLAILALGLGAGHYMIEAKTSPQQKVDAFLSALAAGDSKAVMKEITIPAKTEKDDRVFTDYLKSQDLEAFQSRLYEAVSGVKSDGISRFVSHENGEDIFRITQDKFIGLYPVIEIEAIPVEVELSTNIENAKYQLGDKTVTVKDNETDLGAYLPGTYQSVLTVANGDIIRTMKEEQIIYGEENQVIELLDTQVMVKIYSNDPKAIVYLDGKSTGKAVEELSVVGPILKEDTLSVRIERKNKKGKIETSVEDVFSQGELAELPIFTEEDEETTAATEESTGDEPETTTVFTEEALEDFIIHFRSAYQNALNNKSFSIVDNYLMENEVARKEIVEFIGDIGNDYYNYSFTSDDVIKYDIHENYAYVTTFEEFDFTNHLNEVTNYKRNKRYKIIDSEDGYKITEINILDTKRAS